MEQRKLKILRPLPKKSIAALNRIVKGIESGKYLHKQSQWHCGSAHCIAGWHYVLAAERIARKLAKSTTYEFVQTHNLSTVTFEDSRLLQKELAREAKSDSDVVTAGTYTVDTLGLSEQESLALFHGDNTLEDIKNVIQNFSQGLRYIGKLDAPIEQYITYTDTWVNVTSMSYRYFVHEDGSWVLFENEIPTA